MSKAPTPSAALITGGGTGIGRAITLALAARGLSVAIGCSRSVAEAEATAAEASALGVRAIVVQGDVAVDAEARRIVHEAATTLGGLDVLVNNAGITRFVPAWDLEALDDALWDRILAVNVKGAFHCARAAVHHMEEGGSILNISSAAGLTGRGSSIPYCASKAALIALTKSLSLSLAPKIRVNAVAPGFTETPLVLEAGDLEGLRQRAREATPLRRVGQPEDVAAAAIALALDMGYVTGQTLVVDGGRTLLGATLT